MVGVHGMVELVKLFTNKMNYSVTYNVNNEKKDSGKIPLSFYIAKKHGRYSRVIIFLE